MRSGSLIFGFPCTQLAYQPRSCQGGKRGLGKQTDFWWSVSYSKTHSPLLPKKFLAMVVVESRSLFFFYVPTCGLTKC